MNTICKRITDSQIMELKMRGWCFSDCTKFGWNDKTYHAAKVSVYAGNCLDCVYHIKDQK